ncbi:uncharacterized protein C7orf57 homolog isoform X1 [Solea solea]|uniref:uncharacterized protein C7orf57 homolog isoform X1 n=1 Tax=Solea solea TaxID=90069 RepID=UPI0027295318|nr:uncharacterized protein C7orf57 homolog isoform X1 [Solea solea]
MEPEKSTEITSNDHQATKPAAVGAHISQIPGLSSSITSDVSEEKTRGRRVRVLDTDSDYVKLAKQGGHKGLLCHEETSPSSTDDYKRPDWFTSSPEDDGKTISSEKKKNPGAFQTLAPPFGTDNMSTWEREEDDNCSTERVLQNNNNNNLHHSPTEKPPSLSKQHHATGQFRRIVFDKKPAPVDMSKLLSFGYADDDKPTADNDASN